jgi:hypothetical protein
MITREMEAIIPEGSMLKLVGTEWYINWAGVRVPVNKYVLIGAEEVSAARAAGATLRTYGSVAESSLPSKVTYLTFGVSPAGVSGVDYTKLSESEISALAKTYGISTSEMKTLIEETTSSISDVSNISTSGYSNLSKYLSATDMSELSKIDYKQFATELTKLNPDELATTLNFMSSDILTSTLSEMTLPQLSTTLSKLSESNIVPSSVITRIETIITSIQTEMGYGDIKVGKSPPTKPLTLKPTLFRVVLDGRVHPPVEAEGFVAALAKVSGGKGSRATVTRLS